MRRRARREVLSAVAAGATTGLAAGLGDARSGTRKSAGFHDGFEDGRWRDDWQAFRHDGEIEVVEGPAGESKALSLVQGAGGGTANYVGWQQGRRGWDRPWTLAGAFYTEQLRPDGPNQIHRVPLGVDPSDGTPPAFLQFGIVVHGDEERGFELRGSSVDEEARRPVDWARGTLYEYAVSYDGDGNYTCCLWAAGKQVARISGGGDPLPATSLSAGIIVNGSDYTTLGVQHLFMQWSPAGAGSSQQTPAGPGRLRSCGGTSTSTTGSAERATESADSAPATTDTAGSATTESGPRASSATADGAAVGGDSRPSTPTGPDEWLEGWYPLLVAVAGIPVVGPVVLGALVALSEYRDSAGDDGKEDGD